jgi:DNA invertase Pin-like site-specific DNA recombinase/transcription elongation factor Elf1
MEKLLAPNYRVGIYCRLSKDDDIRSRESASISHQRELLADYCGKRGWKVEEIYTDDGYSGLNQNRPELKRLLADVEDKRINLVITKDYSRLGRNHLETEHLREDFFPRHDCRYIAVNDNIDSLYEDDLAGFKAVINEQYSKDISKKVHSSYQVQAEHGKFTGVVAPFGYIKDPDVKGHLLIDEETCGYARQIFEWAADGRGISYIKRRLEKRRIPCPTWWNRQRGLRNAHTRWELADSENGRYVWDESVLKTMLMNPAYYGAVSGQKKHYKFKLGVLGDKKPEEWIVVEGMHEPIIDKETFDTVQMKVESRKCSRGDGTYSLFAGLIRCGQCGKALTIRKTHASNPIDIYACITYNRHGKQHCTQHRVEFDMLYDICLNEIRELANKALNVKDVSESVSNAYIEERRLQDEARQRNNAKAKDRLEALDRMVARLYDDLLAGKINEHTFDTMMSRTQAEQETLKAQIAEYDRQLSGEYDSDGDTQRWHDLISEYADIKELDAETLNRLIKNIVVHEEIDGDGVRHISIEIHYNFKPVDDTIRHDYSYKNRTRDIDLMP